MHHVPIVSSTPTHSSPTCSRPPLKRRAQKGLGVGTDRISPQNYLKSKDLLSALNLDVIIHLCTFLHPLDLLNLTRTSKSFHSLLMSKAYAFVWKAARLQVEGMPDCPSDLSEQRYANLAFGFYCHNCGKEGKLLFWQFRARYCSSCVKLCTINKRGLPDIINKLIGNSPCLPMVREGKYKNNYHTSHVNLLKEKIQDMRFKDVEAFLQEQQLATLQIQEHATLCEVWYQPIRYRQVEDMMMARENGIRSWMRGHGWELEVEYFSWDIISQLPVINTPKPLTPRALSMISKPLNEWMNNLREVRLEETVYSSRRRILMEEYKAYLRRSPQMDGPCELMPHVADVAAFKLFEDIIKSPPDVAVTASSFSSALVQLPNLIPNWRRKVDRELVSVCMGPPSLTAAGTDDDSSISSRLHLASTVFFFPANFNPLASHSMLFYPEVLAFRGFVEPPRFYHAHFTPNAESVAHETMAGRPWSAKLNEYGPAVVRHVSVAAEIIRICGMDPAVTTVDDMNRLDPKLRCNACLVDKRRATGMAWRTAIYHAIMTHGKSIYGCYSTKSADFTPIRGVDELIVRVMEKKLVAFDDNAISYICKLCQRSVGDAMRKAEMLLHLRNDHQVPESKITRGLHYFPNPNDAPVIFSPVVLRQGTKRSVGVPEVRSIAPFAAATSQNGSTISSDPNALDVFFTPSDTDSSSDGAPTTSTVSPFDTLIMPIDATFDSFNTYKQFIDTRST